MDSSSFATALAGAGPEERLDRLSGLALAITLLIAELAGRDVAICESLDGSDSERAILARERVDTWRELLALLEALPTTQIPAGDEGVRLLTTQLRDRLGNAPSSGHSASPRAH